MKITTKVHEHDKYILKIMREKTILAIKRRLPSKNMLDES